MTQERNFIAVFHWGREELPPRRRGSIPSPRLGNEVHDLSPEVGRTPDAPATFWHAVGMLRESRPLDFRGKALAGVSGRA